MNKHRCKICAYIYDPSKNSDLSFDDLPSDWKCPVCGATKDAFEIIHKMGEEYTGGEAQEKHVPVLTQNDTNVEVSVGSVPHPMEEGHHITHVELYNGETLIQKVELEVGKEPIATFEDQEFTENLMALAYCNLHGIWESK